jgi:hypothetical protein
VREVVVMLLAFVTQAAFTGMHGMAPKCSCARCDAWTHRQHPLANQARKPLYAAA